MTKLRGLGLALLVAAPLGAVASPGEAERRLAWGDQARARPGPAAPARIPVILDTDLGDDIDDTWALVLALKSPELDVKLVVTDFGNTVQRARLAARVLELAGRTDIPIAIGIQEDDDPGPQAEWVSGYDLSRYPGRVRQDGVQALIDTVMASPQPMTLIAIGPPPTLAAALAKEPRLAERLRFAGMYGSIRRGYGDKPPEPEWNVKTRIPAIRAVLAAPWREAAVTPLDTCGQVRLGGERYARLRRSGDPLLRGLVEAFGIWCRNREWCAKDRGYVAEKSSTLFDTVAVYLAVSRELVRSEALGVRVTDEGMTVPDGAARPMEWAVEWRSLDGYEEWLTERMLGPVTPR
jgi:inosine-uridine nucleoside N-ribohydrolase